METTLSHTPAAAPEVIEYESCYLFRFAIPEAARKGLKLEIIDNELLVKSPNSALYPHVPSFIFPRAIDTEQSRAAFVNGALTVIVPKRTFTKYFQLPIEEENQVRWKRLFGKQLHNHYFVEMPRIAHPAIAYNYAESRAFPVATGATDRPECL